MGFLRRRCERESDIMQCRNDSFEMRRRVNEEINAICPRVPYALILVVFFHFRSLLLPSNLVQHCLNDVIGNNVFIISLFLLNLPMEFFNVIKVVDRWERSGLINTTNAVALARTHHWPTIVIFHKCVFYSRVAFNSTYISLQWRRTWFWS